MNKTYAYGSAQDSGELNSTRVAPSTFWNSALSAFGETLGMRATPDVETYRGENFWAGLGSQIVGSSPFYIGGSAALNSNRFTAGLLDAAERAVAPTAARLAATQVGDKAGLLAKTGQKLAQTSAPFLTGAARYGTEAALLEGGRLALTVGARPLWEETGFGSKSFGEELGASATNLAASGILGGTFRAAGSAIRGNSPARLVPQFSTAEAPIQISRRIRDALQADNTFSPSARETLERELQLNRQANLRDALPSYDSTGRIQAVAGSGGGVSRRQKVALANPVRAQDSESRYSTPFVSFFDDLFRTEYKATRSTQARLLVPSSERGLPQSDVDGVLEKLGLSWDTIADETINSRVVDFNANVKSKIVDGTVVRPFSGEGGLPDERLLSLQHTTKIGKRNPAVRASRRLVEELMPIENGFRGREMENGLWLVAKKIDEGVLPAGMSGKNGKVGDRWFIATTDNIAAFAPEQTSTRAALQSSFANDWVADVKLAKGLESIPDNIYLQATIDYVDALNPLVFAPEGKVGAKQASRLAQEIGRSKFGEGFAIATKKATMLVAPSAPLAATNKIAATIHGLAKLMDGMLESRLTNMLSGHVTYAKVGEAPSKSLLKKDTADGLSSF
ncbi:MAG: hypothetical protein ACRDAM_21220, partial [Casimicrobium sp.]